MGKKEWGDAAGDLAMTRGLRRRGFRKLRERVYYGLASKECAGMKVS